MQDKPLALWKLVKANVREGALQRGKKRRGVTLAEVLVSTALVLGIFWLVVFREHPRHLPVGSNEAATIADIRAIVDAQRRYAKDNAGRFGLLHCLSKPTDCGAPSGTRPYLDPAIAASPLQKSGYARRFFPGPQAAEAPRSGSTVSFTYSAVPLVVGRTGARAFAADESGRICTSADGSELTGVRDGRIVADCQPVR